MKQIITIQVNAEVGTEPKQVNAIVRPSGLAIVLVKPPYQRMVYSIDATVRYRTGATITHIASGRSLGLVHSLASAELACRVLEAFSIDWHASDDELSMHPLVSNAIATADFAHGREMVRIHAAGEDTSICPLEEI